MSDLPYSDPSNPALPSPLFSDITAVRADHMRANNAAIFADLIELNSRNPELVALTSGSFKTAALANANTYNGRSFFTCTAGVSDTPFAGAWRIFGFWNPADSSGRFVAMADTSLETWVINYAGAAWGAWTILTDTLAIHKSTAAEISAIAAKALPTNADRLLIEDAADSNNKKSVLIGSVGAGVYVPKFITGLTLSNAADADHDITVAAGARSDSTNRYVLQTDGITKQLDASWAAGTDAGGLFTGSIAPSTWYHTFLIRKDSDGTVDAGFDTSLDAVHIPVGYTAYGYIGSVKTDASSKIIPFTQAGNIFSWNVQMIDLTARELTTSPANFTVSVPLGIRCLLYGNVYSAKFGTPTIFIYSPDMTIAPAQPQYTDSNFWAALSPILTNRSSQIRIKASENVSLYLTCSGYMNTFL